MNWRKVGLVIQICASESLLIARADSSLLNQVDSVLQQIDSVTGNHTSHTTHAMHSGNNASGEKKDGQKKIQEPITQTASKPLTDGLTNFQIQQAKQQIALAESEILKLKQTLTMMEAKDVGIKEENIQRIIHLNKGLIRSYDKTVDAYKTQGLSETAAEIQQAKKGIAVAQREIDTYQHIHDQAYQVQQASRSVNQIYQDSAGSIIERRELMGDDFAQSHRKSARGFVHTHGSAIDISKFKFTPFGYIKYEPFYHTRQLFGIEGEDQIYLLPATRVDDANNQDVKARGAFQLTYINTHIGCLVEGPLVLGAKPYADFSFEYFGPLGVNYLAQTAVHTSGATHGLLHFHSAIYIDWPCTSLIFGQTWHPWVDPEIMVSRERVTTIGSLAEPLARKAQMRFTQHFTDYFDMILAIYGFIDEKARTNIGIEHEQLQNVPAYGFHAQARFKVCENIYAIGADIQTVKPRLFDEFCLILDEQVIEALDNLVLGDSPCGITRHLINRTGDFKTNAGVTSFSMFAFAKLTFESVILRAKILAGSNINLPIGGYAVSQRRQELGEDNRPLAPLTCYTPMRLVTGVFNLNMPRTIEPGIFFGFTKNLGANTCLFKLPEIYNNRELDNNERFLIYRIRPDLDYTVTISPYIKYHADPLTFGGEIEFMRAAYGQICGNGTITCSIPVDDIRFIASVQYIF